MTETVPAVVIERPTHTVVVAGEDVVHLRFEMETTLYGTPSYQTPVSDSLIASLGPPFSISWSFSIDRVSPFSDDEFPMSMPKAIGNVGWRGDPDEGVTASIAEDVDTIYMSHLYVQEEARRMGYGQLMWDTYLATVAYGDYRAAGGIGSTEGGGTVRFLRSQGVPEADISPGRKTPGAGTGLVKWSTPASNVTSNAPIRRTEVEV